MWSVWLVWFVVIVVAGDEVSGRSQIGLGMLSEASWELLACSWEAMGELCGSFGPLWERSWDFLGRSWVVFGFYD